VSSGVSLINFIDGEVGGVDIRRQSRLEWSTYTSESVKRYTAEEGMTFDLISRYTPKAVFRVTDETSGNISFYIFLQKIKGRTCESSSLLLVQAEHPPGNEGFDAS
jgi:hypothetical protein